MNIILISILGVCLFMVIAPMPLRRFLLLLFFKLALIRTSEQPVVPVHITVIYVIAEAAEETCHRHRRRAIRDVRETG